MGSRDVAEVDLESLPSDIQVLEQILETQEQQLKEVKQDERKRRQEKFRARKQQQQQQQQQQSSSSAKLQAAGSLPSVEAPAATALAEAEVEQQRLASRLSSIIEGLVAELAAAGLAGNLDALRQNLAVAQGVLEREPELGRECLRPAVETWTQRRAELEQEREAEQARLLAEQEEAARLAAAELAAAADDVDSDGADSCTSDELRVEKEIRDLEAMLTKHAEGKLASDEGTTALPSPRQSYSSLSCCSLGGENSSAAGGSAAVSRCTSPSSSSVPADEGGNNAPCQQRHLSQTPPPLQPLPLQPPPLQPPPPTSSAATEVPRQATASPQPGGELDTAKSSEVSTVDAGANSAIKGKGKGKGPGVAQGKGPGKGCGKPGEHGKGAPPSKGPGKGAPPPKCPPQSGPKSVAASAKVSRLVSLHWKVSHEPMDVSKMDKHFFKRIQDAQPHGYTEPTVEKPPSVAVPDRPTTIFHPVAEVQAPPQELFDRYFTKSSSRSLWLAHDTAREQNCNKGRQHRMLDEKRLNMLGIMIQKHLMEHKDVGDAAHAILQIKRGVLRCDSSVVRLEGLSVIRTVLRQHDKDGQPITAFVRLNGEAALENLDFPEHHRLVFEMSKVPQIDERLECMLFCLAFKESIAQCQTSLRTLRNALEMLNMKRDTIRRFFVTAHRLGQSLNRESNAPKAPRGFQLSTLEKLSQTKSTKFPKLSILHFVLALMRREEMQALFEADDIMLLQKAKALKTHKVYQDSVEIAQGIYGVQQICETGKYTCPATGQAVQIERRRKTLPPSTRGHGEPAVDTDDCFHDVMREFVEQHLQASEDVAESALNMILTYKELALFFDDLSSVYPPPKNENDPRKDLCDIFYRFAEDIRRHRDEVDSERVRKLIAASGDEQPHLPPRSRSMSGSMSASGAASPRLPPQLPSILASPPPRTLPCLRQLGRESPATAGDLGGGGLMGSFTAGLPQHHELLFTPKNDLSGSGNSFHNSPSSRGQSPAPGCGAGSNRGNIGGSISKDGGDPTEPSAILSNAEQTECSLGVASCSANSLRNGASRGNSSSRAIRGGA